MDIKEEARPVIEKIGIEIFGERELALNALHDFDYWYKPGERPSVAAWKVFVYYLELDNVLEAALNRALQVPTIPKIRDWARKSVRPEDAEEVAQTTKIYAHKNFHLFKPYHPHSWVGWQYMIAESRRKDILRKLRSYKKYRYDESDLDFVPLYEKYNDVTIYTDSNLEKGWSIPFVCEEWMCGDNPQKAQFAAQLLLMYHNLSGWDAIYGRRMQEIVGAGSSTLQYWFSQFSQEVIEREEEK